MPELLTPELLELRRSAVALAQGPLAELRRRTDLDHRSLRSEVAAASRTAGVFGLTRAHEPDSAPSALGLLVAREALASHDVIDLPGIFGSGPGLLAGVDEPLRSAYLEPVLAGEKQGSFGFTEPDGAVRHTWAVIDGDHLVVNGQKSYVTGGADADFINTLVEVDATGPAMVLIDTATPGVAIVRRFESLDGSHHAAVSFSDVRVPLAHILGEPGKGMHRAVDQVGRVRMAIAASCLGLSAFAIDHVDDYLRAPHRSGSPLGNLERHRLRFGEMRIKAYAARSAVYRTARLIDTTQGQANPEGIPAENTINEIMMAKYLATETVGEVVDAAIQTVGGQALTVGHPLESIHRRVRSQRLAEGQSDVLALNIARGRLDLGVGRL